MRDHLVVPAGQFDEVNVWAWIIGTTIPWGLLLYLCSLYTEKPLPMIKAPLFELWGLGLAGMLLRL